MHYNKISIIGPFGVFYFFKKSLIFYMSPHLQQNKTALSFLLKEPNIEHKIIKFSTTMELFQIANKIVFKIITYMYG